MVQKLAVVKNPLHFFVRVWLLEVTCLKNVWLMVLPEHPLAVSHSMTLLLQVIIQRDAWFLSQFGD